MMTKDEKPLQNFAIEYEGKFCGVISLLLQPDVYKGSAEIGYWLGEPFWKKGIATEAVRLITEYGFTKLNLRRIYASVFAFNEASAKVLEKNGYVHEGVAKKAVQKNGIVHDDVRYAITQ